MDRTEAFLAGYHAAVELMKAFEGDYTVVDDELVEFLEANENEQSELYAAKKSGRDQKA